MNWFDEKYVIFECQTGSHMYGTSTPESDEDYRGVCIPPAFVRDSLLFNFEQKDSWEGKYEDRVIYSLKKFMKLCADNNPNIVELLFSNSTIYQTPKWLAILDNRKMFISKKCKHTFLGYAYSQLNRIKRHRAWLLNPPKEEPTRELYGLTGAPKLNQEQMGAILTIPEGYVKDEYVEEARKEKAYREAKTHWDMYSAWQAARNKKRQDLEGKFGYDTKHASHLIRLLWEGQELLKTGKIVFPLIRAKEIIEIRNGVYKYDELLESAAKEEEKFESLYETSTLPDQADHKGLNDLYVRLIGDVT